MNVDPYQYDHITFTRDFKYFLLYVGKYGAYKIAIVETNTNKINTNISDDLVCCDWSIIY
jgi:hypothetical protein